MAGHGMCMGKMKNAYEILVGKSEVKRELERSRHRWKDNIKMGFKAVECGRGCGLNSYGLVR
jgi:hypothetical protein